MRTLKSIVIKLVTIVHTNIMNPVCVWASDGMLDVPTSSNPVETGSYVESVDYINFTLLMAAVEDHRTQLEQDPENCQAVLNACLEAVRHEKFLNPAMQMMASLSMNGTYTPAEAIARVLANVLLTGMNMEKRLQKETA